MTQKWLFGVKLKVTRKWHKSDSKVIFFRLEKVTFVSFSSHFQLDPEKSLLSHFWVTLTIFEFWLCSCRPHPQAQCWKRKNRAPMGPEIYPVLGLGPGERLLWHFQTPVLYWINLSLRLWDIWHVRQVSQRRNRARTAPSTIFRLTMQIFDVLYFFLSWSPSLAADGHGALGWTYKLPGGQKFSIKLSPLSLGFPQTRPSNLIKSPRFINFPGCDL